MTTQSSSRIPPAAAWLGGSGAIPFVALCIVPWVSDVYADQALLALRAYGAVILSFLGGVHWGLAMSRTPDAPGFSALSLSVIPSLIGWVALLLPSARAGLFLLAVAIIAMLAVDVSLTRRQLAPAWYQPLRIALSVVVFVSLSAGALSAS